MFRYETFLLTLSLRFRHKEERHNLAMPVLFIWPLSRAAQNRLAAASPKVDRLRPASNFNSLSFFWFPQNSMCASGAWRHSHPVTLFDHLGLLWHLWVARPPSASVTTYIKVCTLQTHMLSWKVLSLTKLKGMNRNPLSITLQTVSIILNEYTTCELKR